VGGVDFAIAPLVELELEAGRAEALVVRGVPGHAHAAVVQGRDPHGVPLSGEETT
jgi:hypothetical protein